MPETVLLRYFDCRGRAQPLRDVLIDAGVEFQDDRIAVGPGWLGIKAETPFGALPVLLWGDQAIAQTLAIANFLARRLGQYDGRSDAEIARLEMLTSAAYLDLIQPIAELLWRWGAPGDEAGWRGWFAGHVQRFRARLAAFEALSPTTGPYFGGDRPAVADYFLLEAVREWRLILGRPLLGAMDACPRLGVMIQALEAHAEARGCLAPERRPTAFSGNPQDAESLKSLQAEAKRI